LAHILMRLLASVLCIYIVGRLIEGKSRQVKRVVLIIVGLLAIFPNPMRFEIKRTLVDYQPSQAQTYTESTNREITLVCRIMNGQTPGSQVVITERNVEIARPIAWDDTTNYVELVLDQEGSKRMQTATAGAVGKNMGFWIDGVLVASPEIMAPLTGGEVYITGNFDRQKAREISRRFNARKR